MKFVEALYRIATLPVTNHRPWVVDYELIYDGGGIGKWTQGYRTKAGMHISRWRNLYVSSWGGRATIRREP